MKKACQFKPTGIARGVFAATLSMLAAHQAQAMQLDFGEGSEISGSLDFTLGYATSYRASDAKSEARNPLNSSVLNPGVGTVPNFLSDNRVPDAGDRISNVFKGTAELGLEWQNFGFKGTAAYQYDSEIMDDDAVDFLGNSTEWTKAAEDYAGSNLELLDAYVYGSFDLAGNPLDLRVGKQVINWGEGLYFVDGVSVQVPLNANKLVTPGSELKEAYIGVNGVYAQLGVGDNSSLGAYVQTSWERAEFAPRGTFYGDDFLFRGATETDPVLMTPVRANDVEADDDGQWGVSFRTFVTDDTELGFYYSRYHETAPFLQALDPLTLRQIWPEDLDMYGASVATTLGAWSVNGEIAYRPNRPLWTNLGSLDAQGRNLEEHDTINLSVHGIWLGGALPLGIDSQTAMVQFGVDYISGDLTNLQAHNSVHDAVVAPDRTSYGLAGEWNGTWTGVYPGTDLTLGLFLQKDLHGNSHFWGNFAEDRLLGTVSLTANVGNAWEARLGYNWIKQNNSNYETQDSVNLSVNYKF
jgi:hypothetical protein